MATTITKLYYIFIASVLDAVKSMLLVLNTIRKYKLKHPPSVLSDKTSTLICGPFKAISTSEKIIQKENHIL